MEYSIAFSRIAQPTHSAKSSSVREPLGSSIPVPSLKGERARGQLSDGRTRGALGDDARLEQAPRIVVLGRLEDRRGAAFFDHLATIHHVQPVAEVADHRQVVG